ncbi:MAG: hypothetical protein JXA24_07440, partial [Proteobacteria bacterium]|nr:hypothetical protein [Pseudomonadota bacterium]
MRLSERGAIRAAIAEGGFGLYPAGRLMERIKAGVPGDELKGDFDPSSTADKVALAHGPQGDAARAVFSRDIGLIAERLRLMKPEYDIESVFDSMQAETPALAKRYYGIEEFTAPRPCVVEYFFEGITDIYRDGDWFAFNVNRAESAEMNVPVGTYFRRDQVSPGQPEFTAMHEANHAMQDLAAAPDGFHHYVPWFDEGLADVFGRMMLFRATRDEALISRVKRFRTEVEADDPRRASYHYADQIISTMLTRARLPFAKALMRARKRDPFSIDWSALGDRIISGIDPHVALLNSYQGAKRDQFAKKFEREETAFRKDADLDGTDLRVLSMFLASERPACLSAEEYRAAIWLSEEIARRPSPHSMVEAGPSLAPASSVTEEAAKKDPSLEARIVIRETDVPYEHKAGVGELAAKYMITKRMVGEALVYQPYGGGLPYRLGTGEI